MIKNIIEIAKENTVLKIIEERRKRKERIYEANKKRYWKLTASERLHYDSVRDRIKKKTDLPLLLITFPLVRIFFYLFGFFLLLKLLFDLDKSIFIPPILKLMSMIPLVFELSIAVDIIFAMGNRYNMKKEIKRLNKNYGFKQI